MSLPRTLASTLPVALGIATVLLLVRLVGHVATFAEESVQMDLSSYYAAGQAVSHGLSPYVNHVDHDPPIWDGVDLYRHSRFLYPPLAARLFQPLSLLPYRALKALWMGLSLAAIAGGLLLALRLSRWRPGPVPTLLLIAAVAGFHPLLTLLERGQIDGFTLVLILGALLLGRPGAGRGAVVGGGALLALATLLKLNCVFLLPFLALRRRWRLIGAYLLGGLALVAAGAVVDGPGALGDYVKDELPRISRYGEDGTRAMLMPVQSFRSVLTGVERGKTVVDNRSYREEAFSFVIFASLVNTAPRGWTTGRVGLSALLLLVGFVAVTAWWLRRRRMPTALDWGGQELCYWQAALIVVLLCGPVTWAMNVVWMLPLIVLVLHRWGDRRENHAGRRDLVALALCSAGFLLVAVPDAASTTLLSLFGEKAPGLKYVIGESIGLAGVLALWRSPDGKEVRDVA